MENIEAYIFFMAANNEDQWLRATITFDPFRSNTLYPPRLNTSTTLDKLITAARWHLKNGGCGRLASILPKFRLTNSLSPDPRHTHV